LWLCTLPGCTPKVLLLIVIAERSEGAGAELAVYPPAFLFSSQRFRVSQDHVPQLHTAQHILIKTLLKEGFETKLIASEASCSVRAVPV
jgi:hypothetical protein